MAQIYPFRAWRYNLSAVRLEDVVTQPYDKISPAMQQAYYQRSPFNLVRIILGLPELFDAPGGENVYARAARNFRAWREQGVLIQEKAPCVFAYAQRFVVPGSAPRSAPLTAGVVKERRGFIALGRLYDYAEQMVFRHEQTLSKPKSDRLNLLRATRAHFGQIFMLYSDPAGSVEKLLYDAEAAGPPAKNGNPSAETMYAGNGSPSGEVTDEYGVLHRVWRISDPALINQLTAAMADKKLIIADGHHRYETALNYSREFAPAAPAGAEHSASHLPQPPYPEAAAMMTFVNMDSGGLVILPTHRVVHSLAGFDPAAFARAAAQFFAVQALPAADPSAYLEMLARQQGTAFVAVTRAGDYLLRSIPEAISAALAGLSGRQRQLDLTQLHAIVLERLLGLNAEQIRDQTHLRYLRSAAEAVAQVRGGQADVAFLTHPVTMDQLREVAFAGEVMPQKSTDFYPKLLSGLAIYALE